VKGGPDTRGHDGVVMMAYGGGYVVTLTYRHCLMLGHVLAPRQEPAVKGGPDTPGHDGFVMMAYGDGFTVAVVR
jgi:hypothetical protein